MKCDFVDMPHDADRLLTNDAHTVKPSQNDPDFLSRSALIKLLKRDDEIRRLIRHILEHEEVSEETSTLREPQPCVDPLRRQLAADLEILGYLHIDRELRDAWLGAPPGDEGQQLRQWLAVAAQWDRLLDLWGLLAQRCKQAQRAATPEEQRLLAASLAVHNLIWRDKAASLASAEIGAAFSVDLHERGALKGGRIRGEWLPGLKNPGGQLQRKPLVDTE